MDDKPVQEEELQDEETPSEDENKVEEQDELSEREQGLVAQIKELRKKNQEQEAINIALSKGVQPEEEEGEDDVEKKVKAVLSKERKAQSEKNVVKALEAFKAKHPEYKDENDTTGLLNKSLMNAYGRLNTSNSFDVDDILKDFEDARRLSSPGKTGEKSVDMSGFASESSSGSGSPPTSVQNTLNAEQEKLRKQRGWTVEKYVSMHQKYPDIIP